MMNAQIAGVHDKSKYPSCGSRHPESSTGLDSALQSALDQALLLVSHLRSAEPDRTDVQFLLTHALAMLEFARVAADESGHRTSPIA